MIADRESAQSPVRELLVTIRQLAETADSNLPPSAKLDLLIVQIGTARFWADQLTDTAVSAGCIPAPHFDAAARETASLGGGSDV